MTMQCNIFKAVLHSNVKAMAYTGNLYSSMLGMREL